MRPIDADEVLETMRSNMDMQELYLPTHFIDLVIEDMPTIEAEPDKGWISVEDRLPPYGERVLVVNEAHKAKCAFTMYDCGVTIRYPHLDFTFWGHKVTHWMPLPEPPKGE